MRRVAVGTTADYVGTQFAWGFGAVYSPVDQPWGVRLEVNNSRFDITDEEIIDFLGAEDGHARTWDIGLTFEAGSPKSNPVRVYGLLVRSPPRSG